MLWQEHGLTGMLRHTVYSLIGTGLQPTPNVGQFFSTLLLIVFVCALAYYTTRLLGAARFGRLGGRRNLEILETLGVGSQSFVQIVRVGEKYVLIGVTRGQVSLLTQLEEDQLKFPEVSHQVAGFDALLNRFQKKGDFPENGRDNKP